MSRDGSCSELPTTPRSPAVWQALEAVVLNAAEPIAIVEIGTLSSRRPRIEFINHAFTSLTGYGGEVVGQSPAFLWTSTADGDTLAEVNRAFVQRRAIDVELRHCRRKDGSTFWSRVSISPLSDADEPVRIVVFHPQTGDRERSVRAPSRCALRDETKSADKRLIDLFPGDGPATRHLRQQILQAARSRRLPALVLGERGTGKAIVARQVHDLSPRAGQAYVAVDCAAIPGPLFESELFGHEKGAFTGANTTKRGLFQLADGGTLFLDEIGELSLELQAKLLTATQEHRIRRVGGTVTIPVDVRIVAATSRDLLQMRADGRFREDLYDRLLGFPVEVPRLRDREDDITLYVQRFVQCWADEERKTIGGIEPAVMDALRRYPWPGNVRQLELVIGRMVARAQDGDSLDMSLLPTDIAACGSSAASSRGAEARADERDLAPRDYSRGDIETVLTRNGGIVRRAAMELGVARNTLYRLMGKHGIRPT